MNRSRVRRVPANLRPSQKPTILVAGIGNIFLGDDAFGVEVVRRLAGRKLPESVRVADFGIRGFDLAYALQDGYETTILRGCVSARRGAGHAVRHRAGFESVG